MKLEPFDGVKNIPLDNLILDENNDYQMRYKTNDDMVEAIQESLKNGKIIEPIAITLNADDTKYIIIDGQHRFKASQKQNLSEIPAIFINKDEAQTWGYSANLLRTDYNCVEKAKALDKLQQLEKLNNVELAKKVGLKPNTVGDYLVILKLDKKLLDKAINLENYSMKKLGSLARNKKLTDDERYNLFIKDAEKKYDMDTGKPLEKVKTRRKNKRKQLSIKIELAEEQIRKDIEILRNKIVGFEQKIKKYLGTYSDDESSRTEIFKQYKLVCDQYAVLENVLLTLPPKKIPTTPEIIIPKKIQRKAIKEAIAEYDDETDTKTYTLLNIPTDTEITNANGKYEKRTQKKK